jgi:hypothetical protein
MFKCQHCSCRIRLLENQVFGRMSATRREEVKTEWRKLHDEKLFWFALLVRYRMIISTIITRAKHVASTEHTISAYRFSVGKRERKQPASSRLHSTTPPSNGLYTTTAQPPLSLYTETNSNILFFDYSEVTLTHFLWIKRNKIPDRMSSY